ncbi:MAG: hypothetical protein WD360_07425 [Nitriliruptoraceae bacterium]
MNLQPHLVHDSTVGSHAPLAPVRQARYVRRRIVAVGVLAALVFALGVVVGGAGATAEIVDPVAGYEVVAVGETLWDVAVRTAPDGVDPRRHLASVRELNGFDGAGVTAWTVIAIPAQ